MPRRRLKGPTLVDRCICKEVPFTRVAELGQAGMNFEQAQKATGCGTGCGICTAYCKVVIATGRTSLPVMTDRQAAEIVRQAEEWKAKNAGQSQTA